MAQRKLKIVPRNDKPPVIYFRPGEVIPETGIYRVFHSDHRVSHEVTLLQDEKFPECSKCKEDVHFQIMRSAPHIVRDVNFGREPIRLYQIPHPDQEEDDTQQQLVV